METYYKPKGAAIMITLSTSGLIVLMVAGYLSINSVIGGVKRTVKTQVKKRTGERQER